MVYGCAPKPQCVYLDILIGYVYRAVYPFYRYRQIRFRRAENNVARILLRCGKLRRMPRKIRQLIADLERAGFVRVSGGKGSHHKFKHPKFQGALILSSHDGDDAKHYQEKQVSNALREVTK